MKPTPLLLLILLLNGNPLPAAEVAATNPDEATTLAALPPATDQSVATPTPVQAAINAQQVSGCEKLFGKDNQGHLLGFTGYSTLGPDTTRIPEKMWWDPQSKSFKVQGPNLRWRLGLPDALDNAAVYTIQVGRGAQNLNYDRDHFRYQQTAWCDASTGALYFRQVYQGSDFQQVNSLVRITRSDLGNVVGFDMTPYSEMTSSYAGGSQVLSDRDLRTAITD